MSLAVASLAVASALVLAASCSIAQGADIPAKPKQSSDNLQAAAWRPEHPLLIGKERSTLLRIEIDLPAKEQGEQGQDGPAKSAASPRLQAIAIELVGDRPTHDLQWVALESLGDGAANARAVLLGEPIAAADKVRLPADAALRPGRNVFQIVGRISPAADLSHKLAARCVAIETTAGSVAPDDRTPEVRQRIGVALRQHNDDGVHTHRIPALATANDGTLLCVYDLRRRARRDLQEDIDIGLSRSTDGGRTWEPVQVVMDMGTYGGLPAEQNGCSDPGLIVDRQTGEIFCFAVWMWGKPGLHQWVGLGSEPGYEIGKAAQFMMVRSRDHGRTWTKPENITRQVKPENWVLYAPSPQQGICLPDGTLVMPAQGRDENDVKFANLLVSRDHGVTWRPSAPAYQGGNECQAALLGDGTIMLNIRNNREKFRAVAVTSDLGQTWRQHPTSRNTLIEPTCNGSLFRFTYNDAGTERAALLFANPHSQAARVNHSIQVSLDDGLTWPAELRTLLDAGRGAGYPSLTRIDDRHVGIVYEGSQADLTFERLSIDELLKRPGRAGR